MCTLYASLAIVVFACVCCLLPLCCAVTIIAQLSYTDSPVTPAPITDVTAAIVVSTVIIEAVDVTRGSVISILLSNVIGNTEESSLVDKTPLEPDVDGMMYTAVVSSGMPSVVSISYRIKLLSSSSAIPWLPLRPGPSDCNNTSPDK